MNYNRDTKGVETGIRKLNVEGKEERVLNTEKESEEKQANIMASMLMSLLLIRPQVFNSNLM